MLSAALMALASAATPEAGQLALDRRVEIATIAQVSQVWVLSLISGRRARWYAWFVTAVFVTAAAINMTVLPLAGTVSSVERVATATDGSSVAFIGKPFTAEHLAQKVRETLDRSGTDE